MRKFTTIFISFALAASLFAANAAAHDKDHGRGNGRDKHADHDNDRDHDRDNHGPSSRSAGWDKGKKTGWGNCNVPPGQAKKAGCGSNSRASHHVDRVKHEDHDKHVRRDDRRDRIADHRTADRRTADARRDTRRDIKSASTTTNNQPGQGKGGSRVEHSRMEALRK